MGICGDPGFRGFIIATAVQNVFLQILGAIVNALSLWCLWKCRRTGNAIKLQLALVFILLFLLATVILPGEGWINYLDFFCRSEKIRDSTTIFFLLASGFILQLERMNISSVAIYRFIAVKFPQLYKRMTQVKVVAALEVIIFIYISIPYLIGFTQPMTVARFEDGNQYVKFGQRNSTVAKVVYRMYAYNFLIPFLITLTAYSLMAVIILYQKFKTKTLGQTDHVTFTIQLIILIDLVLDAPHAIAHFTRAKRSNMTIVHMVFHMHLIIDPLIFLFLNPHNRRVVVETARGSLPQRFAAYLPPATASTNTGTPPKDSHPMLNSPTPHTRRKYEINRPVDENSLILQKVGNPPNAGKYKYQEDKRDRPNTLGVSQLDKADDGMSNIPLTPLDDALKRFDGGQP
ncbi:uncharacterized protein LOC135225663 isoform X2 [Macrobrachium nipponense]|uniref:uncharacterized protein LOC135225663 isoform X2 n=1 Tax=Macrobrachium nipponense TaxID=159736 RepID=UPI0030C88255